MVILSILFLALNLPLTYYRTPGKSFLVIASYDFSPEFLLEIVISSTTPSSKTGDSSKDCQ